MLSATDHDSPAYREAIRYLYSFVDYERNSRWKYDTDHFNLDRVREFFRDLGDPHLRGTFVHIAGTNGKGSTAAMTASALRAAGYRTGLYTSPHLVTFRERIRIDGALISPEDVVSGVERIRPVADRFPGLTFFDIWTGLAFDHFARSGVDAAVIEVGMGGRLDTTNLIVPAVSVITSISKDHCQTLGDTLSKIASEKAGIIKPGVPAVSAPQQPEALAAIREAARNQDSPLVVAGTDTTFRTEGHAIDFEGCRWMLPQVPVPLAGAFQAENTAVALTALEQLAIGGLRLTPEQAREGVASARWPGRLQTVRVNPAVIVDGACNAVAVRKVAGYLRSRKPAGNTVAVFGICRDKDVAEAMRILGEEVSAFVFTQAQNPRAVPAEQLASFTPGRHPVTVLPEPSQALAEAVRLAGPEGLVIVTGSLYLVGEILKEFDCPGSG